MYRKVLLQRLCISTKQALQRKDTHVARAQEGSLRFFFFSLGPLELFRRVGRVETEDAPVTATAIRVTLENAMMDRAVFQAFARGFHIFGLNKK